MLIICQHQAVNIKRPAVLVCHGGGYGCVSSWGEPIALEYIRSGYQGFVSEHLCAPNAYPQQISEVACAVAYINEIADEFSIDTEKILIIGFYWKIKQ